MRNIILWILFFSISSGLLFASTFFLGVIPDRRNVDVVTSSFIESRSMVDEYFRSRAELDRVSLIKRIKENGSIDNALITQDSILLIDKNRKFSVLIEQKQGGKWKCTIFPEVSYKNLCSMLNNRYR